MSEEDKTQQPPESEESQGTQQGSESEEKKTPAKPAKPGPSVAADWKTDKPAKPGPSAAGKEKTDKPAEPSASAAKDKTDKPTESDPAADAGKEKADKPAEPGPAADAKEKADKPAKPGPAAAGKEKTDKPPEPGPAVDAKEKADKPAKPGPSAAGKEKIDKPPARPAKKQVPTYEDLVDDPILKRLQERFPEDILSGQSFLDQATYTVSLGVLHDVLLLLRDDVDSDYDYLVDLTALDYLGDEKRFCLVYHLYSHKRKSLIRIRCSVEEGTSVPSASSVWKTANWMEREVYDLFGIDFSGHPDLKRILLPDDWHGYPLRKDYDIKLQDQAWIREHLQIRKTPE